MSAIYTRMSKDDFFRMGYFYQTSGDLHAAAECYIRSIENGPNPEAHTFLGWVLALMGDTGRAILECKKAIKLDPEFGNAWNDIGAYLTDQGKSDQALHYLRKACRAKNYDSPEFPHYNLARVYLQKDMWVSARKELFKALKINPGFMRAKSLLERIDNQIH